MNNFVFSLNVVLPLFVLMATGYGLRQIRFLSDEFLAQLNRFVFRFMFPVMLFHDIQSSYTGNFTNTRLILAAVSGTLAVIAVSFLLVPLWIKRKGQRGSVIQAIYRSNFLIYGLPVATSMYGGQAIATISMLMGIMIPLYNVAAVIILSIYSETGTQRVTLSSVLKDVVMNPLIQGCFFGLVAGACHLQLPEFLDAPISQVARAAAPLALLVLGGEFHFQGLGRNMSKIVIVTTLRLVIVPVVALYIFVNLGFRNVELSVLLSIFATPTAMASYIMSKNMGCDGELSAQIVVLTTTCSCITIFFLVFFLRTHGYL